MEDPWEKVDSATLAGEPIPEVFDDNFRPDSVETAKSTLFERLPDSSQYLANLGVYWTVDIGLLIVVNWRNEIFNNFLTMWSSIEY